MHHRRLYHIPYLVFQVSGFLYYTVLRLYTVFFKCDFLFCCLYLSSFVASLVSVVADSLLLGLMGGAPGLYLANSSSTSFMIVQASRGFRITFSINDSIFSTKAFNFFFGA